MRSAAAPRRPSISLLLAPCLFSAQLAVVHKHAVGGAFHIVKLLVFHRPEKNRDAGDEKKQAQGDQQINDFHQIATAVEGKTAEGKAVDGKAGALRRRRALS